MRAFDSYGGIDIFVETGTDWFGDTNIIIDMSNSSATAGAGFVAIMFYCAIFVFKLLVYAAPFVAWKVVVIEHDPVLWCTASVGLIVPAVIVFLKPRRASEALNLCLLLNTVSLFVAFCILCYVIKPGDWRFDEFEWYQPLAIAFLSYEIGALPAVIVGIINGFILKAKAKEQGKSISVKFFGLDITVFSVLILCCVAATFKYLGPAL